MDINSQQLINTFVGGMNTDTSDSLLESNQYRYAENLRVVTNTDSNSGELRMIEGTKVFIPQGDWNEIIKIDKVRDIVVFITRSNSSTWSIWKFKDGGTASPTRIFGPCSTKIWKTGSYPNLSTVLNYESENNIKYYIADGIHQIMVLVFNAAETPSYVPTNIKHLSGYTEIMLPDLNVQISDRSGQLKSAKVLYAYRLYKYGGSATKLSPLSRVLSLYKDSKSGYASSFRSGRSVRILQPSAEFYTQSTLPSGYFVNPRIYISTDTVVDNQGLRGTPTVPLIHINDISFSKYSNNGNLQIGESIHDCYYIEDTLCTRNLDTDPLSPSEVLYSYSHNTAVRGLDSTHYFENSGDDDSTWIQENSRLIVVQIGSTMDDNEYECSNVVEFTYDDLYQLALSSGCIVDDVWQTGQRIQVDSIQRTHPLGNTLQQQENLSVSEVLDRILIFRINYVVNGQSPEVNVIYDGAYVAGGLIIDSGQDDLRSVAVSELLSYVDFGVTPKVLEVKNNYLFAANINYSQLKTDDLFKNLDLSSYFTIELCTGPEYTISETSLDLNYQSQHAAFRPGETYRFGVIFYDNEGNRSSVFPLGNDVTMNDYSFFNWLTINQGTPTDTVYSPTFTIKPPTVKIKQRSYIPNCSRYEIVRCIRTLSDKRTLTQGLIARPAECWDANPLQGSSHRMRIIGPRTLFSLGETDSYHGANFNDEVRYVTTSDSNILCFASPEYVYQQDDVKDMLNLYQGALSVKRVANYIPYIKVDQSNSYKYAPTNGTFNYPTVIGYTSNSTVTHLFNSVTNSQTLSLPFTKNNKTGYIKFNHITPHTILYYTTFMANGSANITDLAYPNVPAYNAFANGENLRFKDDVTTIGDYSYLGWSALAYNVSNTGSSSELHNTFKNGDGKTYPIGTTGACVLMKVDNINTFTPNTSVETNGPFLITVADIYKSANPYGGDTSDAKRNSTYCSFGDVFENRVADHVLNSGDCYIRMFQYNALHNWYDATFPAVTKCGTVYSVPMFMDIDLHGQYGTTYTKNIAKGYYIQDKASQFDLYIQETDAYLYNTAYNQHPDIIKYSTNDNREYISQQYDTRVHYSKLKTNNEDIDSWTQFRAMNFSDVDSRFGEITGLKLFKDKLIFWQENATGVLAVNERVILQDANDTQVTLGTGQVLDRYDYISTVYGMKKDQSTACVSNDALYWWDGNNRELLQYAEKYSVVPLSQVKNIRNYINNSAENNHPHVYYNNKYKEVVFQCVNNEAVAYSEILQRFTSVYTAVENNQKGFIPADSACVNDTIYITDGKTIETDNTVSQSGSKLFGYSAHPYIKYIVNANNTLTKTFDTQIIGGELYGGSTRHELAEGSSYGEHRANGKYVDSEMLFQNQPRLIDNTRNSLSQAEHILHDDDVLKELEMRYNTPLKQTAHTTGTSLSNREYDYRLNIPRETGNEVYGGRLKGKTMQCELWSTKNSIDFSLQYIITKYRMSWS